MTRKEQLELRTFARKNPRLARKLAEGISREAAGKSLGRHIANAYKIFFKELEAALQGVFSSARIFNMGDNSVIYQVEHANSPSEVAIRFYLGAVDSDTTFVEISFIMGSEKSDTNMATNRVNAASLVKMLIKNHGKYLGIGR